MPRKSKKSARSPAPSPESIHQANKIGADLTLVSNPNQKKTKNKKNVASLFDSPSTISSEELSSQLLSTDSFPFVSLDPDKPPSNNQLVSLTQVPMHKLPRKFRRDSQKRVFVNRSLNLTKIKCIGFDMDYTLANYNSPQYETLCFRLAVQKLIKAGYPKDILENIKYDPDFAVRGVFIDQDKGNVIKIDQWGRIVKVLHGKRQLTTEEAQEIYPEMFINPHENQTVRKRYWVLDTLFHLPFVCLFSDLIDQLEKRNSIDGKNPSLDYCSLFLDVYNAVDKIHLDTSLKRETCSDLPRYVERAPPLLARMLTRIRASGKKVVLITNSWFFYTNRLMTYLLDTLNPDPKDSPFASQSGRHDPSKPFVSTYPDGTPHFEDWKKYFDVIIVAAKKPSFFSAGSTLREVDLSTGSLSINKVNQFQPQKIYHGGNNRQFTEFLGCRSEQILYVGDHIASDVMESKALRGWRTMLIIPELSQELKVRAQRDTFLAYRKLMNYEWIKAHYYRSYDANSLSTPDFSGLSNSIVNQVQDIDSRYNPILGSLFRTGSRESYFSHEVRRFADLYAAHHLNLLNYPLFYQFTTETIPLPHEVGLGWMAAELEIPSSRYGSEDPSPADNDDTDEMTSSIVSRAANFPDPLAKRKKKNNF